MKDEIRVFADGILNAIGQPLLTDAEATRLPEVMDETAVYKALADIINEREFPEDGIAKLNAYAILHNVDFSSTRKVHNNIFIGAGIEN